VALLVALILLLMVGVGGASVYFVRRQANPLVSGATGQLPSSPGVAQGVAPGMPNSPNIISGDTAPPPGPGSQITSGARGPDGMAPSVLMAPGMRSPSAGSVTQAPSVRIPEAAGITQGIGPQIPPSPSVAGALTSPPANNSDLDAYIKWLQFIDNARAELRAQGTTEAVNAAADAMRRNAEMFSDPDNNNELQSAQESQQRYIAQMAKIQRAMAVMNQNILRTKPPVPKDCKALDEMYMTALRKQSEVEMATMRAFDQKDIGKLFQMFDSQNIGWIDQQLVKANNELQKVFRNRGMEPTYTISSGSSSGASSGLKAILGF
jgi:hypothetical protein